MGRRAVGVAALVLAAALLAPAAASADAGPAPPNPVGPPPLLQPPTAAHPSPAGLQFSPGPFVDLLPGYWAFQAISSLAHAGLALVPASHTFDPYGAETRAAWVEQVYLTVKGAAPPAPASAPFADVPPGLPGAPEIAQAKALGWIPFPVGADFQPGAPITREEAFSILSLAFLGSNAGGSALPFADAGAVSAWARAPMAALWAAGLITGDGSGQILPQESLGRADAAALLDAVLQHVLAVNGHRYRVLQVLRLRATAYGDGEAGMGSRTATGTPVHLGEAAADPHYLPYGTTLWVTGYDGYGYLPAGGLIEDIQDTGLLAPGQIDLYMSASGAWPYQVFGVQMVTGYVLDPTPLA